MPTMPDPKQSPRSVKDIRTHSGTMDGVSLPYKAYMRISCLELEKARRLKEREGAMGRVRKIDERVRDIDAEKTALQATISQYKVDNPPPADKSEGEPRRSAGRGPDRDRGGRSRGEGFKIRY